MSVVSECKWLSKPQECQVKSIKKVKSIKNVKVSGIASQILGCGNNRVMCEQGSEQWWAKKEKSQTKD